MEQLRTQIEYYFSDANLRNDKFFQNEMRKNDGNWLNADVLLNCGKIKALGVKDVQEIANALTESELEVKSDNDIVQIRRTTPLPPLKQKKPSPNQTFEIYELTQVPEDITWNEIKDLVAEQLATIPTSTPNAVRVVSRPDANKRSLLVLNQGNFEAFTQLFPDSLLIKDQKIPYNLLKGDDYKNSFKQLPRYIFTEDKASKGNTSAKNRRRQVRVGGMNFASEKDLQMRLRSWLDQFPLDMEIEEGSNEYAVLRGVLEYHPRAAEKMRDMRCFTVGLFEDSTRCYYVLRTDGTKEDFSIKKCIEIMKVDPHDIPVGKREREDVQEEKEAKKICSEETKEAVAREEIKEECKVEIKEECNVEIKKECVEENVEDATTKVETSSE